MPPRNKKHRTGASRDKPGHVRIIGGQWRGRKLPVFDAPGLRPTGDRVRETLFNWLQTTVPGAFCADFFAGTGALGFEAASRGAQKVTLVERSRPIVENLRESALILNADQVEIVHSDALAWLDSKSPHSLDLVFVDPPFDSDLAVRALQGILDSRCLKPGAVVYLESSRQDRPEVPSGYVELRQKIIGEVRMQLLQRCIENCS